MKIALVCNSVLPAQAYGGTERVVWDLGAALSSMGHEVKLLAAKGSVCPFAEVVEIVPGKTIAELVPHGVDVIHFNNLPDLGSLDKPYIVTIHGNNAPCVQLDKNSVFVSSDHARRYGSDQFVYNGLDWNRYPMTDISNSRNRLHFLGKGAWRVKNMKGAIRTARLASLPIDILGANRLSLKMGIKFSTDFNAKFHGMVTDAEKARIIPRSRGLVFPVIWPEPFGLAITESFWYGAPLYGTPYGSLPELVGECGFLSNSATDLAKAIEDGAGFDPARCRDYAGDLFNSHTMAKAYLSKYEKVMNGETLNPVQPQMTRQAASASYPFFI
ncbi:MAG: glycosyltransferase [Muribaculaceae bacterium]|nr:glycosyltransferase [Muribaculaceae bacterium]